MINMHFQQRSRKLPYVLLARFFLGKSSRQGLRQQFGSGLKLIFGNQSRSMQMEQKHFRIKDDIKNPPLKLMASKGPPSLTQEITENKQMIVEISESSSDPFADAKQKFLAFKQKNYSENYEQYQNLADAQSPKFLVIACADSRVCPSTILGFQPGDAFMVRNIANLVPPYENGPTETNAALEFSVNTLEVENILVIGHSRCGGIRALMSMPDDDDNSSSFIKSWVVVGKSARSSTKATASNLCFDQQCTHCEKESINRSLVNLLSYPWIQERVTKGTLTIHGGYYNFVDCTFEKWTLNFDGDACSIKNREYWS